MGQVERDTRVTRISISPGDVTLRVGERIIFAATAYDPKDAPVGGTNVAWRAHHTERNQGVRITRQGEFAAQRPGTYRITAEVGKHSAQVTVRVNEGRRGDPQPVSRRTSRDSQRMARRERIATEWDESNIRTAFDPLNRRGRNPVYATPPVRVALGVSRGAIEGDSQNVLPSDKNAGNRNFQLSAPVVRLPGRGLDLALDLRYNSLLWHRDDDEIIFDIDRDWPAPGWSLGFGKLVRVGWGAAAMLYGADGTRHRFNGTPKTVSDNYWVYDGHTTDGSFIDYTVDMPGQRRGLTSARAKYPNGTVVEFTAPGDISDNYGTIYPTRITDANGNFITVTYRNNTGPEIETITDTLGRKVVFHYDANNRLTAVTGPGLNGGTRTLIRLTYERLPLTGNFDPSLNPHTRDNQPFMLQALYYPGTASGYWFGDTSSSYSAYGMIAKVSEQRAMGYTGPPPVPPQQGPTEQGTITSGRVTRQRVYNYPLQGSRRNALKDAPAYTTMTETWEAMDTSAAVTRYNATRRQFEVTYPNGTRSVQTLRDSPGQFDDGLLKSSETLDATGKLLSQTEVIKWDQGDYESPRPLRTEVTDELGQKTATEVFYWPSFNQVMLVREMDYGGSAVLRSTMTQYETSPDYIKRHIFSLPRVVEIYEGNSHQPESRKSRTEYIYDGQPLADTPGVVQHSEASNPYAPRVWVPRECHTDCVEGRRPPCQEKCSGGYWETEYKRETDYRGHVTQVKTYTDATNLGGAITENRRYDITGNLVSVSSPACCEQTSFRYTSATRYAYPEAVTRGAADLNSAARVTTTASYNFATGLVESTTDPDGRITGRSYYEETLRPKNVWLSHGGTISYEYDDAAMTVKETTTDWFGISAGQSVIKFNGLGLVRRQEVLADDTETVVVGGTPTQAPLWNIVETQYDAMGRLWKETRPFRRVGTPQWSEISYDPLGRVMLVRAADGSEQRTHYDEVNRPGGATRRPGQTTRTVDAWGRERWTLTDALGRLREVVEPVPNGDGSVFAAGHMKTFYNFDVLDRLTHVEQDGQARLFRYDSLGRLSHQYLSEKLHTLNEEGVYSDHGEWSDVFTYDERSNLTSHIDARGVKTVYDYANDPLNRLQAVTYDTTGFKDVANPVLPASSVSYQYMTTGDVMRVRRVATAHHTEEYGYDTEAGRLNSKKLTMTSRPNYPLLTEYTYDGLDRVQEVIYPAEYGTARAESKVLRYDYGKAGRLVRLGMDQKSHASQFTYNAADQMTSVKVGESVPRQVTETYEHDAVTGMLKGQKVQRTGAMLLDLSYDYLRVGTGNGRTGQLTRLTNNHDAQRSRGYEYDALGRLIKATGGDSSSPRWTQSYSYDRYGNRTGTTASGTAANGQPIPRDGIAALSYDARTNRINTPGFNYDAAGNLVRGQGANGKWQRYQYDAAGRLAIVRDDNNTALEINVYGADNHRLFKTSGDLGTSNVGTYYAWNGDQVIAEYMETTASPSLQWAKSCVYLGGRLLSTLTPGGAGEVVRYHHPDRLGTRLVTNATDANEQEQVTLPFGVELNAESTSATNPRFTSYDRSAETGQDYAVNRHYDAQQGRFTQVDPLEMGAASLGNPQSMNLYTYVRGDPINLIDPLGLKDRIICVQSGCYSCNENGQCTIVTLTADEITVVGKPIPSGQNPLPTGRSIGGRGGGRGGGGGGGKSSEASPSQGESGESREQCMERFRKQGTAKFEAQVRDFRSQVRAASFLVLGPVTVADKGKFIPEGPPEDPTRYVERAGRFQAIATIYFLFAYVAAEEIVAFGNLPANLKAIDNPVCGKR